MSCKSTRHTSAFILLVFSILLYGNHRSHAEKNSDVTFDHSLSAHAKQECIDCHPGGAQANQIRPGTNSHLTCAGSSCHQIFERTSSKEDRLVCLSCHQKSKPWEISKEGLKEFPPEDKNERSHCTSFPHKTHLAFSDKPINDQCVDCHQGRDNGPSHSLCSSCHVEPTQTPPSDHKTAHKYDDCDKCHQAREKYASKLCTKWSVHRKFRVGKRFDHKLHELDIREDPPTPLSCGNCHPHVAKHDGYGTGKGRKWIKLIATGAMAKSCGGCHNGYKKNPKNNKRIFSVKDTNACYKCHPNLNFSPKQQKRGHGRNAW